MTRLPVRLKLGTKIAISSWVNGWLVQEKVGVVKDIVVMTGSYEKINLRVVSITDQEYFILEKEVSK